MIRRLTIISFTLAMGLQFVAPVCQAQDPEFSQFYANPLYLNPAFAGSNNCPRIALNYRNQWPSISGTFVTSSMSFDQFVESLSGGLGLLVTNDSGGEGTLRTSTVSGIYAYRFPMGRAWTASIGFQGTYWQKVLDKNKLSFGDQINPVSGFVHSTAETLPGDGVAANLDVSSGVLAYTDYFYVGFAANHLTQPNESVLSAEDVALPIKYTAHMGAVIPLEERSRYMDRRTTLSPNILFQQQGEASQLNLGMYLKHGPLTAGVWYRSTDAAIALIGIQTKVFRFGYSYDFTVSNLTNITGGAHEISIQILVPCRVKRPKFRTISCPSF
jgi:type IX secretion system PorP/SprF family membrane protein